jgi:peptidoglycan/xylan/chitin deacetylase (PgdA/CDA1 family)
MNGLHWKAKEKPTMRSVFQWTLVGLLLASVAGYAGDANPDGWKRMFDGKTLNGWKTWENPQSWTVENGELVGQHAHSHLFYMDEMCENCEFYAEIKLNHDGNSGMYFRGQEFGKSPKGYEAQLNSTNKDPAKTGSLMRLSVVRDQLVPDDTWFSQHIIADGNHIIIKVNDKVVVDYIDEANTYKKGYLALQQHNEGSVVRFRNLKFRKLPAPAK